jgi:hypothetical protein
MTIGSPPVLGLRTAVPRLGTPLPRGRDETHRPNSGTMGECGGSPFNVGCCMSPGHCHTKRERRQEALELRKAGKTYTQIAQELGCSNPSVAGRYVRTALQQSIREPTAEVRELSRATEVL